MTLILSNEEIDQILTMDMALECVEQVQRALEAGEAVNSPRVDTLAPTTFGETKGVYSLKSMTGVWPAAGMAALRINSDVLVWPEVMGNVRRDRLPSADGRWNGMMLLFSMETGAPVMICPDGYISRMRVGAANGLAARYLAREDARVMALLGTGWQAGGQLMAHCAVRPITEVRVFSPNPSNRERFCRELAARVEAKLLPSGSAEEAIEGADLVVTGTNSMEPVHRREWLAPGVHYSAVKVQEMDEDFLDSVDRVFVFSKNPATTRPQVHRRESVKTLEGTGGWCSRRDTPLWDRFEELPQLLIGATQGRQNADQTTAFVNNVGQGLQFAAVAQKVYREAVARGVGHDLPTEWFTQNVHP
jgi:alanine dehydrogenase